MKRMPKTILAILFIAVIAVSAISMLSRLGQSVRVDMTDRKLYTLSDGTRNILAGIKQPITIKLYFSKTASSKAPDQIRFYTNYYNYVRALLEEYSLAAKGMIKLEIIDPRPYTDDEMAAIRYGLKRFNISEEESFFFGLVLQTQFGVTKNIEFFTPDRQSFVEYDISYLIDTAMTRQKKKIGILSSAPVMGDEMSGYMAYMMQMQGQQPRPAWGFVNQLKQMYEVSTVTADTEKISDLDLLMVIQPKDLPDKTLFAIEQYILNGGKAMLFVDPYCVSDRPDRKQQNPYEAPPTQASNLDKLFKAWGVEMPAMTFAGDRNLAVTGSVAPNRRPEQVLGIMKLESAKKCFNGQSPVSAMLNEITVMFPGTLKKAAAEAGKETDIQMIPLVQTTAQGNSWKVEGPYELMNPDYAKFLREFRDGSEPVVMACLLNGKFKSAFPDGVKIEPAAPEEGAEKKPVDPNAVRTLTGLTEARGTCSVAIFADVDFISDLVGYQTHPLFGTMIVGDGSALMLNTIEDLAGSSNLMAVRSRGQYSRPFVIVDKIVADADKKTLEEENRIMAQIKEFQTQLNQKLASMNSKENELINKTILAEKKDIELKLLDAEKKLRQVKMSKYQTIEELGLKLKNICTLPGPAAILLIAIVLGIRRSFMRRHYISHASDA